MCIPVYNLESYEYFQMGICGRSLYHSFTFINMKVVDQVIFCPIKFYKIYSYISEFYIFSYSHHLLSFFNSFPFLMTMLSQMSKFRFTENNFLPRLIKQGNCRSSHCIFQSVYALNTRSIKILRRSVIKVLITPLIKQ